MRYQSFYPFSQSQLPQIPNHFSVPPNRFPGGPSHLPIGLGNGRVPGPGRGNGGISGLSRMLGLGSAATPSDPASMLGQGASGLPTGTNRMEQYLQTADRFLSTAQQITPMVKQVAPMVQNIPALLKIYRGFQNTPDATAATSAASNIAASAPRTGGVSQPRIFQPPN